MCRQTYFHIRRLVSGFRSLAAVKLDHWRQLCGRHADIGERQRQSEFAGSFDAALRTAGPDPDRQAALRGARRNRGVVQAGTKSALPGDPFGGVKLHQQLEFFLEQLVIVGQVVTEQRKGLREYAASCNDLGAAVGDEVQCGKVFEHRNRIGCAQDGDRARQADPLCYCGDRRQHHGGRRNGHIQPMMLAGGKNVET